MSQFKVVLLRPDEPASRDPRIISITHYGEPLVLPELTPGEQERVQEVTCKLGREVMREYLQRHPEAWRLY